MADPIEEEVIDNSINECPPGQEKNELGECVDVELSPYDILPENDLTKEDFPKIKNEYKENLKEKAKTERDYFSSPYEVILSIESKEKIENFNSKYELDASVLDVKNEGKIDEKASLAKGEELFNKLVLTDETINKELIPETAQELQPVFEAKILELRKKYNGTTSEEWVKAEEEYNKFYNDQMMEALGKNAEYQQILNAYENIVGDEIESEYRAINRIRLGLEDNADMSEGWKKFKKNLNKSWIGLGLILQGDNVNENEFTKLIDQKIKEGVITSDTVFADINDIELKKAAQKIDGSGNMFRSSSTKTINDIVNNLKSKTEEKDQGILRRIGKIEDINADLEFFKKAKLFDEDGLTFDEFQMMVAEQIPQLALSLLPYGIGVMGQEAGGNYVDNLYAAARKEFDLSEKEKPSEEQLLQIINEGKDSRGIAVVSGIVSGQLERLGAKKVLSATLGGTKAIGSLLRGEFKQALRAAGTTTIEAVKSGMWEAVTETGQTTVSQAGQSVTGSRNYFNFDEVLESAGQGALLGTVFPLGGGIARQSMTEFQNTAAIVAGKFNREATENYFKKIETSIKQDGRLTPETRRQRIIALGEVRSANMKVPKNMGGKVKSDAIKLLVRQQQIKNQYKGVDNNLIPDSVKTESQDIGDRLKALATTDRFFDPKRIKTRAEDAEKTRIAREEDTRSTKDIATDLGFGFEGNLSVEELRKIAGKNFDNKTLGFIKKGTIYLNQEALKNSNAVKTSSHELLHGIVMKSVGTEITQSFMKDWMQTNLNQSQRDIVEGLIEQGGYNTMKVGGKSYLEVRPDEYLTQIYEAGIIDQPGMFEKVKVLVQDILNNMSKALGYEGNFNFATKDDLTEFLREYQKSIKEGKLSQQLKESKFFGIDNKKGQAFSQDTTNNELVELINNPNVDERTLGFGVNQLIENNFGVISRAMGFQQRPGGISAQSVKDAIQEQMLGVAKGRTGQRGGKSKLLQDFDLSKGEVTTRLGSLVKLRQAEILERAAELDVMTREGESLDSERAKQVADTSTEITPKKPSSKKTVKRTVDPKKVLPQDKKTQTFLDETQAAVEAMSDQDLLDIRYKSSQTLAAQAFADIFGVDVKVITDKSFNLSDIKNLKEIQMWIKKNADTLIRLLPEGNTTVFNLQSRRKNKDGTFKIIKRGGENVGLPTLIRNAFYIQKFKDGKPVKIDNEAGTSKSNQYDKRSQIARDYFLDIFGIQDETFDTRTSAAQAIKGLLEITSRNITNYVVRQEIDSRPNLTTSQKALAQEQVRDGISDLAFSKGEDIAFAKANMDARLTVFLKKMDLFDPKKSSGRVLDHNNEQDREFFKEVVETIFPEFIPVEAMGSGTYNAYTNKRGKYQYLTGAERTEIVNGIYLENQREFTDTERYIALTATQDLWNRFSAKRNPIEFGSQEYFNLKDANYDGMEFILDQFAKMVKKYPQSATVVNAMLSSSSSYTGHMARQFSFPRGVDSKFMAFERQKNKIKEAFKRDTIGLEKDSEKYKTLLKRKKAQDKKYKTEKEHVWQQNGATELMLDGILGNQVKKFMPTFKQSYFMLGLIEENNSKLKDNTGKFGPIYDYGNVQTNEFVEKLKEAVETGNLNIAIPSLIRYFNSLVNNNNGGFDPNTITIDGKTIAEIFNVDINKNLINKQSIAYQQQLIQDQLLNKDVDPRAEMNDLLNLAPVVEKTSFVNNDILPEVAAFSKGEIFPNNVVLDKMQNLDKQANDARIAFSKDQDLNKDFNEIIERATGIGKEKQYGRTKASAVGANKGRFDLLGIPPSAQDFVGLTRYFAGKGKQGDATISWIKKNFLDPFARANIDISNARVALANDFKALKQLLGVSPKDLNKKIAGEPYTVGNAVRVYTWTQQGMKIPGLSNADSKILNDYVEADSNLVTFANELISINKDNGYPKPGDAWLAGTITTDLLSGLNTVVRAKYLKQWQANVNEVFNEINMNKLEAAFGKGYRDALENMLGRMKTGSNRGFKGDTLTGRFVDWLNGSIGAIMFFNMRSAVLQTISSINFVNWSDNNPLQAAKAFGNQPQYWSDVIYLMNSDYLVERRNGLKINVNEADIAEIAAESKNKAKAFISKLLKLGFLPTQIADSFAIASGGATFYRNRYKSLKKEGLSDKDAEAQAFQDFREIAEESQQSSRPDRISKQQAGPMGRIILAFANTPAQYARLMQKAASDLKNRRGDDKTNISKILYYGFIQNVIFNALQQALFAMAFGDEEPDEEKKNKKYTGIVNGMADSLLRGIGFHGAAISTLKNVIMKLADGAKAQDAAIEALDISPPVSSKIGKLRSAGRTWDWNKKEIYEKGWSLDNPAWLAIGQVISAATNIPLDRGIRKLTNLKDASDAENEEWMRIANALGWQKWELDWQKDKPKKKKKTKTSNKKLRTFGKSKSKKLRKF
jgi:hypothetical protein